MHLDRSQSQAAIDEFRSAHEELEAGTLLSARLLPIGEVPNPDGVRNYDSTAESAADQVAAMLARHGLA